MNLSDKVRIVLNTLGFTPTTLSESTELTLYKAKKY